MNIAEKPPNMDQATWQKLVEKHGKHKAHHQTGEKLVRGRQHTVNDDVNQSSPKKSGARTRSKSPKSNAGKASPKNDHSYDKNLGSPRPHAQLREAFNEALNKDTSHQISKAFLPDSVKETYEDKIATLEKVDILRDAVEAREGDSLQRKPTKQKRQNDKMQAKMAQKTFVQSFPRMGRHGNKNNGFPTGTDADFN